MIQKALAMAETKNHHTPTIRAHGLEIFASRFKIVGLRCLVRARSVSSKKLPCRWPSTLIEAKGMRFDEAIREGNSAGYVNALWGVGCCGDGNPDGPAMPLPMASAWARPWVGETGAESARPRTSRRPSALGTHLDRSTRSVAVVCPPVTTGRAAPP